MMKDRFVESYLQALASQGVVTLPESLDAAGVQRVSGVDAGPNLMAVKEVAWRIDRHRPWRSFVAQRLSRPSMRVSRVTTTIRGCRESPIEGSFSS